MSVSAFFHNLTKVVGLKEISRALVSDEFTQQFSNEEKERLLQKYHGDIGLTDLTFGENAFKEHTEKANQYSILKAHTDSEDTLEKRINESTPDNKEARNNIKKQLKEVFNPTAEYKAAEEEYSESINFFKTLLKKVPQNYSPGDIRFVLEEVQEKARKAIEAQQQIERTELKKALDGPLAEQLNLSQEDVAKLTNDHNKAQKDRLNKFIKTCEESLIQLDKAANKQLEWLLLAAQLKETSRQLNGEKQEEMRLQIAKANELNRQKLGLPPEEIMLADYDVNKNTVSAIDPNHLEFIISLTGNKIINNGNGTWSVHMGSRFLNPLYYLSNKQTVLTDLFTLIGVFKASGFNAITLNINFADPKLQKERARQCYEAALDSGFDPEKIKLKDGSGNEIKPETIFSPGELKHLQNQAQAKKKQLDDFKKGMLLQKNEDKVAEMKKEMQALREKKKTAAIDIPDGVSTEASKTTRLSI